MFVLLALTPAILAVLAVLAVLCTLPSQWRALESGPAPEMRSDAQAWADELTAELDVAEEWEAILDAVLDAVLVDDEWIRLAETIPTLADIIVLEAHRPSRRRVWESAA